MRARHPLPTLALVLAVLCPWLPRTAGAADADSLARRARAHLAQDSPEQRRLGLDELEEAARGGPRDAGLWLEVGRTAIRMGQLERGRQALSRAAELTPDRFEPQIELAHAWKWDWLASLDHASLEQAARCYARACAADSTSAEAWLGRSSLALLLGHPREALAAAVCARRADPEAAEPVLALAGALFRLGATAWADTAFRAGLERLPGALRRRLDEVAPFALGAEAGGAGADSLWRASDPDLTTPENEAELDFLTRVTLALFLFRDRTGLEWDRRAELFARYGPPAAIQHNPPSTDPNDLLFTFPRPAKVWYAPDPLPYPYNKEVWHYPELGMTATLWDRSLAGHFEYPHSDLRILEPRPDPALLAANPDLVAVGGGRGVYRALPPGTRRLEARGRVARFPLAAGTRLVAWVVTPGGPADTLQGSWAVQDASGRVVARAERPLSPSGCDPAGQQVADFACEVPPGDYRVDLAVGAPRARRGVVHLAARADAPAAGLVMSDLVLLCGAGSGPTGAGAVRIEPDLDRRVPGRGSLGAYYELEGLAPGGDGLCRFSYHYEIRRASGRGDVLYQATREETNVGTHRRQFVTAPLRGLPSGALQLRVEVRDLVSGATAAHTQAFEKP